MTLEQSREIDLLVNADFYINKNRKGSITVKVADQNNNPIPNATVNIIQNSHHFKFGSNINKFNLFPTTSQNDNFKLLFKDLFNFCTINAFYWILYQPAENQFDTRLSRQMTDWCVANKIEMKGHPLLYQLDSVLPAYAKNPTREQNIKFIDHVLQNHPEIKIWDLMNEHVHSQVTDVEFYYNYVKTNYPDRILVTNEYGMFVDTHAPEVFYAFQNNLNNGLKTDFIGLQGHVNVNEASPMGKVVDTLELYKQLKKPLHLTEHSFPTNNNPIQSSPWRGTWTEDAHAQYICDYYKICFAHEAVNAISWWDFADDDYAWRKNTGLLFSDGRPKLAYHMLKDLIHNKWKTKETLTTNSSGVVTTSGFYGNYIISATANGVTTNFPLITNFTPGSSINIALVIGSSSDLKQMTANITSLTATKFFKVTATGTIKIVDSLNAPVSNAIVYLRWKLPDNTIKTVNVTTGSNGEIKSSISGPSGVYTLQVIDVIKSGFKFNSTVGTLLTTVTR